MTKRRILPLCLMLLLPFAAMAQKPNPKLAAEVKAEFLHAWNGYKKYAWGHDDLKPLSKTYHDWYAESLLMTPVDALVPHPRAVLIAEEQGTLQKVFVITADCATDVTVSVGPCTGLDVDPFTNQANL